MGEQSGISLEIEQTLLNDTKLKLRIEGYDENDTVEIADRMLLKLQQKINRVIDKRRLNE